MNINAIKTGFALLLGGFIGTIIALQLQTNFWWVGMIAGGFVGYMTYQVKEVVAAFKAAWRAGINWQPNWVEWNNYWSLAKWTVSAACATSVTMWITLIAVAEFIDHLEGKEGMLPSVEVLLFLMSAFLGFATFFGLLFALTDKEHEKQNLIKNSRFALAYLNPVSVCLELIALLLFTTYFSVVGIGWLIIQSPAGARITGSFISQFFRLIHSDMRILIGCYCALGTGIGYFTGNAIIGGIASVAIGGVIGAVTAQLRKPALVKV